MVERKRSPPTTRALGYGATPHVSEAETQQHLRINEAYPRRTLANIAPASFVLINKRPKGPRSM